MRVVRVSVTTLNLEFLIVDILKKQRNPASTTFKRMFVYRANRLSKDFIRQNKGFKRIKSFKLFNRCKKLDRDSNYNIYCEDNKKVSKNVETEFKYDLNPKLKSFTYIIQNFDLDDSKSSCSISFTNFKDNVENFEIEGAYLAAFNKLKRLLKQSLNKPDLLLYDI